MIQQKSRSSAGPKILAFGPGANFGMRAWMESKKYYLKKTRVADGDGESPPPCWKISRMMGILNVSFAASVQNLFWMKNHRTDLFASRLFLLTINFRIWNWMISTFLKSKHLRVFPNFTVHNRFIKDTRWQKEKDREKWAINMISEWMSKSNFSTSSSSLSLSLLNVFSRFVDWIVFFFTCTNLVYEIWIFMPR